MDRNNRAEITGLISVRHSTGEHIRAISQRRDRGIDRTKSKTKPRHSKHIELIQNKGTREW